MSAARTGQRGPINDPVRPMPSRPTPAHTTPRLYVSADLPGEIHFVGGQHHYLRNVMRLGEGDAVLVFNGRDGEWRARLGSVGKKASTAMATEAMRPQTAPPDVLYAFAPLKQARLDYVVQKAAEMGAGSLQPVLTHYTQVRKLNLERLQANVVEACEQCGLLTVPRIEEPVALADFLGRLERPLVVADEALAAESIEPLEAIRSAGQPLAVLVGPEGGFSEAERALFLPRAVRVSLGPRVLRADTAAVALLALVEAAFPSAT